MTLVRSRTTTAVEVQPWTVRGRTSVAVAVSGSLVRSSTPVAVQVYGPKVRSRTIVAVSLTIPKVRSRTPVEVQVYGGGNVRSRTFLRTGVNAFTGTGVHRSRRRDPNPLPVGTGSLQPGSIVVDPPVPPTPTAARTLGGVFWTTTFSPTAPLASTSSNFVARLAYQATMGKTSTPVYSFYAPPASTVTNGSNNPPPFEASFALPIYLMDPDTPRVRVYTVRSKTGLQTVLDAGVPLPDPALIPGGTIAPSGTDGSVVVICGNEVWELWQTRPAVSGDPSGYPYVCTQAGYMGNKDTHPGIWSAPPSWGVAAAGLSKLGGMLTADDYYSDAIRHPLGLSLPVTGGDQTTTPKEPSRILPATRYDRLTLVPGGAVGQPTAEHLRIPEGSRFRLPASFNIDTYIAGLPVLAAGRFGTDPNTLTKVLVCLRDYGMIVTDSAGVVAFSAENPKTFGTPYNPYALADAPVWGNFGQQIPWSSLVQVAAPTADVSVAGG